MKRLSLKWTLLLSAALVGGCSSDEASVCSNGNALEERKRDAQEVAKAAYSPPITAACPELDPPSDGEAASVGLTAREYGALLRGANGNFYDNGTWWLKATPRGESHVVPVQITDERCERVTFAKFGYDYAFATPPMTEAPACGRYLTGINVGHQLSDSWPEIFRFDGAGLIRLGPLMAAAEFAAFLRLPHDAGELSAESTTVDRIDVLRHDDDTVEFAALASGPTFASALRLVLKVGDESRLSVQLELYPRSSTVDSPLIAAAALSGWFGNVDGRDFDRVRAMYNDGSTSEVALGDHNIDWGDGQWTRVPVGQGSSELESLSFIQDETSGDRSHRSNVTISNLQSSVPIALDLSVATQRAVDGNVIANLLVDSSTTGSPGAPISVSYLVTASLP